ncbi:MAG: proline/glycine betaine ABC transporter permease [Azospirillaceae bacterium]
MEFTIPLGDWVALIVDWLQDNAAVIFDGIAAGIDWLVSGFESILIGIPALVFALVVVLVCLWQLGWRFGIFAILSMVLLIGMDLWRETMQSLALITAATIVSLAIGLPLGIWASRSDRVQAVLRPILDLMQTLPPFVYLIPAAMFFGIGKVPGAIATIIFSMPPAVRLTALGIRQVPKEIVEAGLAFGCTRRQLLYRVQIPNALPTIMAGVNQTIMLALSMVVIASMIGAGGLGNTVLTGIQRLNVGLGFEGGIGVVILAIILDRLTQSFGQPPEKKRGLSPRLLLRWVRSPGRGKEDAAGTVARAR